MRIAEWLIDFNAQTKAAFEQSKMITEGNKQAYEYAADLRRVKALVFMRLNAALDARDKKTIATLTEIQEAMR